MLVIFLGYIFRSCSFTVSFLLPAVRAPRRLPTPRFVSSRDFPPKILQEGHSSYTLWLRNQRDRQDWRFNEGITLSVMALNQQ